MLTDNGAAFTAILRGGLCAIELELAALGIRYIHSRPYHPQTSGKVERFHQTEKKWLAKHAAPLDIGELQAQIDRFGRRGVVVVLLDVNAELGRDAPSRQLFLPPVASQGSMVSPGR